MPFEHPSSATPTTTAMQILARMLASADKPERLIPAIDMVTFLRPVDRVPPIGG